MTPREIIDQIKTFPARERANEIMICHTLLEDLLLIQQVCFEKMQWANNGLQIYSGDNEMHNELRNNFNGQREAYSHIVSIVNNKIELYEYYIKNGSFGDL